MFGLYIYDMAIIVREWHSLKPSYRVFYTAHHLTSFTLFGLWGATFTVFTPAMALGAVIWMTSDVWRWADQVSRLSGRYTPAWVDQIVFWLERSHRIAAYIAGLIVVGGIPQFREEYIIVASAFLMDGIDTWFQMRASWSRKAAVQFIQELCKEAPLFTGLDNAGLDTFGELMKEQSFTAGTNIINEGEIGDAMFMVLDGEVSAIREEDSRVWETIPAGNIFGEMGTLTGARRNATVRANVDTKVGMVKRDRFLILIEQEPELYDAVWRSFVARTYNLSMRDKPDWPQLDQTERLKWIQGGEFKRLEGDERVETVDDRLIFVVTGAIENGTTRIKSPALLTQSDYKSFFGSADESLVMLLPQLG